MQFMLLRNIFSKLLDDAGGGGVRQGATETDGSVDDGKRGECVMCSFVLGFAFLMFIVVVFFVFLFRLDAPPDFGPLSPEKTPPPRAIDEKERDLAATSVLAPGYVIVER